MPEHTNGSNNNNNDINNNASNNVVSSLFPIPSPSKILRPLISLSSQAEAQQNAIKNSKLLFGDETKYATSVTCIGAGYVGGMFT